MTEELILLLNKHERFGNINYTNTKNVLIKNIRNMNTLTVANLEYYYNERVTLEIEIV